LQDPDEIRELLTIFRAIKPIHILEIGSFAGGTLWYWLYFSRISRVMSLDMVMTDGQSSSQLSGMAKWPDWAANSGNELITYQGDSTSKEALQFVNEWFPDGIDFIFLDGGHDSQTVSKDITNYYPLVKPGGVFAMHDIAVPEQNSEGIACRQAWRSIRGWGRDSLEIIHGEGVSNGIGHGIGVIYV